MSYDVVEAQSFWDCVASMQRDEYRADIMDALLELRRQPFKNPKLQTHDVGVGGNGKKVFSSDVGGRRSDRRLIWQIFNRTIVVLLYGTHAVQDRAKRMRIAFDESEALVTIYEQAPDAPQERTYQRQRQEIGKLFMAWTDDEMRNAGFPDPTVLVLRRLDTDEELLSLEDELGAELFELAFNLVAFGSVEGRLSDGDEVLEADEPEATEEDRDLERQLADVRTGAWFTRTEPEFMAEILDRPIEDWMVFLHPDQRVAVGRHYDGPARIRGAAGTGKTVVGLHRAVWLAERNRATGVARPILFTTFIKSLPPVFESLYLRLPGARAGEVEFVHIDRLAAQLCRSAGERLVTAPTSIDAAFNAALATVVSAGSTLAASGFSPQYLRDEITTVIKGRGLDSLDTYLEVARTGRRAPLGSAQRTQVWELMQAWDREMAERGTVDFVDVLLRARDQARALPEPLYSAAIIDEAQDLSLVGLQLVRSLVNAPDTTDRPNGLMLLGDGAQRIYAGGFKLRQAGVEVRGRTTVLRANYRNTGEILRAAMAVGGDADVDDLAEEFRRGDAEASSLRQGPKPLLVRCPDGIDQLDEVAHRVVELTNAGGIGLGDIGVLVPTNRMVGQMLARFRSTGLAALDLREYDGQPTPQVKVGTYHRGKGLEFKVVFLPGLTEGEFPRSQRADESPDEAAEARELAISQLFVAMTRARDLLVVLCAREPSEVLTPWSAQFEELEA